MGVAGNVGKGLLKVVGGVIGFFLVLWLIVYVGAAYQRSPTVKASKAESRAIRACEKYARSSATHPSTFSVPILSGSKATKQPNGMYRVYTRFKVKNGLGIELQYQITCLVLKGQVEASEIDEVQ